MVGAERRCSGGVSPEEGLAGGGEVSALEGLAGAGEVSALEELVGGADGAGASELPVCEVAGWGWLAVAGGLEDVGWVESGGELVTEAGAAAVWRSGDG
jgi:hypothetical protein